MRFTLPTQQRCQMLDITARLQAEVDRLKIDSGMANVYVPHTTAAVTINENADPDVRHDLLAKLEALIPHRERYYQHSEGNSDSHLKTSLTGSSVMVLIESGQLVLGTWQGVYFCEFDGPRQREVIFKLVSW